MVWCGVVWCGVVWCGVVWCGVVWCGVVCMLSFANSGNKDIHMLERALATISSYALHSYSIPEDLPPRSSHDLFSDHNKVLVPYLFSPHLLPHRINLVL